MEIIRIVRFSEKVYLAFSKLLPQLSDGSQPLTRDYFRSILACKSVHLFKATSENCVVGMFTIATYKTPTGIKVWIEDVVVDESFRGKGFGKDMMLFAIGYSKSLGAVSIMLTSRSSRIAANELYSSIGFRRYETNVYKYQLK